MGALLLLLLFPGAFELSSQGPRPPGAVARCGNGGYVFVSTGADTCAGAGGVAEWFAETDAKRAAAEAEARKAEEEAARARKADEAAKAEAERKRAEAERKRKEEERKRKEAEPLVRVTETQAQEVLVSAARNAKNDAPTFSTAFFTAIHKIAPDFSGPKSISSSPALSILIAGPLGYFFAEARERVRKFEALQPPPAWSAGVHILIQPHQIDAPDIEKVVVQRNGNVVPPTRTALTVSEMSTRMNAKRMIHAGEVTYPLSAFDPGAGVTVTVIAIPASGPNISKTFGSLELRSIQ